MLARAGIEVDLGCRTGEQAEQLAAARRTERYLPGRRAAAAVTVRAQPSSSSPRHDLVVFAVPAARCRRRWPPTATAIPERAGVLVLSKGLVPPLGTLPSAYVAERAQRAGRRRDRRRRPRRRPPPTTARRSSSPRPDAAFARQLADALAAAARLDVADQRRRRPASSWPAAPRTPPSLAAAAAASAGPNAAGAAAGKVFAEVDAYARASGARPETFAGLAGAGDLVATVLADGSRNRRAGELLGQRRARAPISRPRSASRPRPWTSLPAARRARCATRACTPRR